MNADVMVSLSGLNDFVLLNANVAALIIIALALVALYQNQRNLRYKNIPPGPKPWPMVGNLGGFLVPSCILRKRIINPTDGLAELAKVYGNIFSLFVGSQLIVVLNGYEAVRDALSNHPEVFSDRPDIPTVTILTKRKGKQVLVLNKATVIVGYRLNKAITV